MFVYYRQIVHVSFKAKCRNRHYWNQTLPSETQNSWKAISEKDEVNGTYASAFKSCWVSITMYDIPKFRTSFEMEVNASNDRWNQRHDWSTCQILRTYRHISRLKKHLHSGCRVSSRWRTARQWQWVPAEETAPRTRRRNWQSRQWPLFSDTCKIIFIAYFKKSTNDNV